MRWSHVALAASLSAAPMQSRAASVDAPMSGAPRAAPMPVVEGPAPAPSLEQRWSRRDHKLRTATFTSLGLTGASAVGLGIAGGVMNAHDR